MLMVLTEWELYCQKLGFIPKVNSLHFGGGTPTFLSPTNLEILIHQLTKNRTEAFIGSIEIDPRTCREDHLKVFSVNGISRVSLGIQDFDPRVQAAINRQQSVSMVHALMEQLRKTGIESVNFDLIYGLPLQTLESITTTMDIVSGMRPDLIAFYAYAHLPEKIKNQKLIKDSELPSAKMRRELYETGKRLLKIHGYDDIGMDHFALPGSFLYEAKKNKSLHRNFMGYVDKKSPILIGLGPTSISDSSRSFAQNAKSIQVYEEKLKAGLLPIESGHVHGLEDLLAQELIMKLMCEEEVILNRSIPRWEEVEKDLRMMEEDGILSIGERLQITDLGKAFLRNVAMTFDHHLRESTSKARFSQTV